MKQKTIFKNIGNIGYRYRPRKKPYRSISN